MPTPAPSKELKDFLAAYPPAVRKVALRARELLLERRPWLVEKVWPGWKAIGYGIGPKMGDMVVGFGPAKAHLGLHLMNGTRLADPEGLLEGQGKTGRHVKVDSIEMLESRAVQDLVEGAFALAEGGVGFRAGSRAAPAAAAAKQAAAGKPRRTAKQAPRSADWEKPVSDEAVAAKTGRTWDEWLEALDARGCATMAHKEIVAVVGGDFGIGPWWQQMVTVGYERARGLRETNETTDGYQVGASKTVAVDVTDLWKAWEDARRRKRWLPDTFTVRKATAPKSMRITWNDGSDLQVLFYPKGDGKSQVTVDHRKLPDAPRVQAMRAFWKERLDTLKTQLEG